MKRPMTGAGRGARRHVRSKRPHSCIAKFSATFSILWLVAMSGSGALADALDPYERVAGVRGILSSVGSDTLANLMTLWTDEFTKIYPNVRVQVQGAGSSTAPPALIEGTSNLAPMSRRMKPGEVRSFQAQHGYRPTIVRVAIDALAVYVHKDNPLSSITIEQLDAVFSSTRRCVGGEPIDQWGRLGAEGSWRTRPIQLYGRNSVSGTYGYFKQAVLCTGDFRNSVNEQPGSSSVVQAISHSRHSIGYSGIGVRNAGVKTLAIAEDTASLAIAATAENAINRTYPLSRYLYIYINKPPGRPLPLLEREFLRMVMSPAGQRAIEKDGYIPLPAKVVRRELTKLDD